MPACIKRWIGCGVGVVAAMLVVLAGCPKDGDEPAKKDVKPAVQTVVKKDNDRKAIPAQTVALAKTPRLLPFKEAVILEPAPDGELTPPDVTHTGKNAVKIFESIANELWDKTTFTNKEGRPIRYQAIIATELGDIHLDLLGNAAPNHVRSFVCLARAGYYDGLAFYYSLNKVVEDNTVAYIETGCPRGTGQAGSGSIGYWLRPEISDTLRHDEGAVGACLGEDPESAACRFHILGRPMPWMDGKFTVFGKVTQGLDVVRIINRREVDEFDRLKQPILIRSVTIHTILE